jgi:hypothetical protein
MSIQFHLIYPLRYKKKTRPGRVKPSSPTLPGVALKAHATHWWLKKSRNQQLPVEKTPEHWPPITSGPTTTAHSATAQTGGWRVGDRTRERTRHSEGIFLTRPEIRPMRGSNPRPRGATWEPQPSRHTLFLRNIRHLDMKHQNIWWSDDALHLRAARCT